MANYSDSRWTAFQYKLDELMNMPENKHKPSPTLMKYLKNTDFLIPASEKERALGVKQSDSDTVEVNILKLQSISTGSARAAAHTGSINDSEKTAVTFTTTSAAFKYSAKGADRTIWQVAEQVAQQIRSASIALHDQIETTLLAGLNTNKNQSVISTTPRSGTWDNTNYIFQIPAADRERWMQRVKGFMREQYYKNSMFEVILDEYLWQEGEFNLQQGAGNSSNLAWQGNGLDAGISPTQELTLDSGYDGMGYIFPVGSIGILPWIPQLNRQGFGSAGANGGLYTTIQDPLGSGLTFAVHEYMSGADNNAAAGETQDVDVQVELSIDLGPVIAPMTTANASPINKFGIQS